MGLTKYKFNPFTGEFDIIQDSTAASVGAPALVNPATDTGVVIFDGTAGLQQDASNGNYQVKVTAGVINPTNITATGIVVVGNGATCTSQDGTSIGAGSSATGIGGTAVGKDSVAFTSGVALGKGCSATGSSSITIGFGASNAQANSIVIGNSGTAVSGADSVAIGPDATATSGSVAIGDGAVGGNSGVSIGQGSLSGVNLGTAVGLGSDSSGTISLAQGAISLASGLFSCAIGAQSKATASNSVAIGTGAQALATGIAIGQGSVLAAGHSNSVIIGPSVVSTAASQLVLGSAISGFTEGYFNGVARTSAKDFLLQTAGGSGTDKVGSEFGIAGGKGTGTGVGGDVVFYTAPPSTTGSSLNSLVEVLRLDDASDATFANDVNITGDVFATNTDAHIADVTGNPHNVTAAQTGAPTAPVTVDQTILRANGIAGEYEDSGIVLNDDDLTIYPVNSQHEQYTGSATHYRRGSWTTSSGDLFTLLGGHSSHWESHNFAIDSSGNFLARDKDGVNCQLVIKTKGGHWHWYNSTNSTGIPTFALTWGINAVDSLTGAGLNTWKVRSDVVDGASAVAIQFDSSIPLLTNGSKMLSVLNDGTEVFRIGTENDNVGVWAERFAAGSGTEIDAYSFFKVKDIMIVDNAFPAGTGAIDFDITLEQQGAIKQSAALNAKATVTGAAAIPFVSGLLFQVDQQGTGTWGANQGNWGQEPACIASRFTSQAGSVDLGTWVSNIVASSPSFSATGGKPANVYNGFSANSAGGSTAIPYVYGMYVWNQTGTTEGSGIFIKAGSSHSAITILDDNTGGTIKFGAGRDSSMYFDGTDMVIEPDVQTAGAKLKVDGKTTLTDWIELDYVDQSTATLRSSNNPTVNTGFLIDGVSSAINLLFGNKKRFEWTDQWCRTSRKMYFQHAGSVTKPSLIIGGNASTSNTGLYTPDDGTTVSMTVLSANSTSWVNGGFTSHGTTTTESAVKRKKTTVTDPTYTILETDHKIFVDATSNDVALTLPVATSDVDISIYIKEEGTYSVTLVPAGSDTIAGDSSSTPFNLYKYETLELSSDSISEWIG